MFAKISKHPFTQGASSDGPVGPGKILAQIHQQLPVTVITLEDALHQQEFRTLCCKLVVHHPNGAGSSGQTAACLAQLVPAQRQHHGSPHAWSLFCEEETQALL